MPTSTLWRHVQADHSALALLTRTDPEVFITDHGRNIYYNVLKNSTRPNGQPKPPAVPPGELALSASGSPTLAEGALSSPSCAPTRSVDSRK